jgi:hypothetical protein
MGHGWGSHGRTWKIGAWGQNIALKTLHVSMGICFRVSSCSNIEMCVGPHVAT